MSGPVSEPGRIFPGDPFARLAVKPADLLLSARSLTTTKIIEEGIRKESFEQSPGSGQIIIARRKMAR
jgi:hypothetical protein